MEYKIKSIKHTGTMGEAGTDRTDGRYPVRIGRTVNIDFAYIMLDIPLFIDYVKNSDGTDYSNRYLRCSKITDYSINDNKSLIVVQTKNSIYEFEKVI